MVRSPMSRAHELAFSMPFAPRKRPVGQLRANVGRCSGLARHSYGVSRES